MRVRIRTLSHIGSNHAADETKSKMTTRTEYTRTGEKLTLQVRPIATAIRLHLGSLRADGLRAVLTDDHVEIGDLRLSAGPATVGDLEPVEELLYCGVVADVVVRDATGATYRIANVSPR